MEKIELSLPSHIAMGLAISTGWMEFIDDTSQPLVGDNYPQIENPVSFQDHISSFGEGFISRQVLSSGRERLLSEILSIYKSVEYDIKSGTFDQLILTGDVSAAKSVIRSQL